jgi:hypothetical protein
MKKLLPFALLTVFTVSQVPGERTATTQITLSGQRCSTAVWGSRGIEDSIDASNDSAQATSKAPSSTSTTSGR